MKSTIIIALFFLSVFSGFSQNTRFTYNGRTSPALSKSGLNEARFLGEVTPDLIHKIEMPSEDFLLFKKFLELQHEISPFPPGNYSNLIDFISVEITATCEAKVRNAKSPGDQFNKNQISILKAVDLGTEIRINIKFKCKNQDLGRPEYEHKVFEGGFGVEVIPDVEAKYPGGNKQLSEYFQTKLFDKAIDPKSYAKIQNGGVKFTVDEKGQVVNAKMAWSTSDPKIDKLIIEVAKKMPGWKPAESPKGVKVKQEFEIPLSFGGGC
ncbi:MAG: energy transducer TonB [Bacteroidota bacterium]